MSHELALRIEQAKAEASLEARLQVGLLHTKPAEEAVESFLITYTHLHETCVGGGGGARSIAARGRRYGRGAP